VGVRGSEITYRHIVTMNLLCRNKYTGINKIWKWTSFAIISERTVIRYILT